MYSNLKVPLLFDGRRHLLEAWVWVDWDGFIPGGRAGDHYLNAKIDQRRVADNLPVPLLGTTIWLDIEGTAVGLTVERTPKHLLSLVLRK